MKMTNKSADSLILGGYQAPGGYPLTIQPGETLDIDPERLKIYDPKDLKMLVRAEISKMIEPVKPEPKPTPAPDKEEIDAAALEKFLKG